MPLFNPSSTNPTASAIAAVGALASDGGDGDVTISGGTTTLSRDMYYNNLTVDGTGILITRGWRVYARKVTVAVGGLIHCDGNNAAGATAGAAFAAGSLQGNLAGAAGGTGVGANSANVASCYLPRSGTLGSTFRGGAGGAGTPNAGGIAGTVAVPALSRQPRAGVLNAQSSNSNSFGTPTPGTGGGAGGGDGANSGGGGGACGGIGFICAGEVINGGTIRAKGGDGGTPPAGNCGGGGGGGGGVWEITCGSYSGNLPDLSGGAAGAGVGTGVAGAAGNAGDYFINQYKAA